MCNTFIMATKLSVNKLAAARMKARYLLDRVETYLDDGSDLALYWAKEELSECLDLLASGAFTYVHTNTTNSKELTQYQIEQARSYPVDQLVEFTRGKAKAWCHDDKTPSLFHGFRNNIVVCPVCDRRFNSIDILRERDGYSFYDAVVTLCR